MMNERKCPTSSRASKRPFAHEMRKGDEYEGLTFTVTPELNQQFLFALEDFDRDYLGNSGLRKVLVHPVILLHMSARTRSPSFILPVDIGSVFARDKVEFHAPARVGEPLHVSWIIADVYEKRGRIYQALDTHVCNDKGRGVLVREAHSVFFTRTSNVAPRGGRR